MGETVRVLRDIEHDVRTEVARKLIHLTGILVPAIYYFVDRMFALSVLIPLTVLAVAIDCARYSSTSFGNLFHAWVGPILRPHERASGRRRLHAATWFCVVSTLLVAAFPKYVAIMSLSILIFGDGTAALVGRRLGRHRIGHRSLEGSLAFLAAALVVVGVTPRLEYRAGEYVIGAAGAVVGTIAELLSGDTIEDNVVVPLSVAATLWLLYALMYPTIRLDHFGVR